jgi:hypothetical protein
LSLRVSNGNSFFVDNELVPSQFFTTLPLPCDPSFLPKYPPSKELDAKLRDEEAWR